VSPKTTGIAFLIAAALAAFLYFYQVKGAPERARVEAESKRLFPDLEDGAVEWIELTTSDGVAARIERRDDRWQLTRPMEFPGDEFVLDSVASTLIQLSSELVFEDPEPLAVYGLDREDGVVRFGAAGDSFELRTGDDTPVGSNTYAAVAGRDEVVAVPSYRLSSLGKALDELRDKRILRFDTASIDRVTATWQDGHVRLSRADEGWRLVEPLEGRADAAAVEALLADLSFLRAEGFLDDPPDDSELGLQQPAFRVELLGLGEGEGEEPVELELAIGQTFDGDSRAVRAGGVTRYRIPESRLADFPREVVAYRFRDLASFPATDAKRLEIVLAPDPALPMSADPLTLTAIRGETGWTTTPESFRPGAVGRLVVELSRLKAEEIVAESAGDDELLSLRLSPAAAVYRVYDAAEGGELLAQVDLGVIQGGGWILARTPGRDTLFGLDLALAEQLPVNLEAFRNRFVAEVEEEELPASEIDEDDLFDAVDDSP
jgi:hypothetical protein